MTHRRVEFVAALSLEGLKGELNKFFQENTSPKWHIVSVNEGDNRSHIAWLLCDEED